MSDIVSITAVSGRATLITVSEAHPFTAVSRLNYIGSCVCAKPSTVCLRILPWAKPGVCKLYILPILVHLHTAMCLSSLHTAMYCEPLHFIMCLPCLHARNVTAQRLHQDMCLIAPSVVCPCHPLHSANRPASR